MAHIYIFSPSSAVRDKAAFRRGVKRLQAQGHQVEVDEAALASHMRFAGDDATRIAAITRAAASGAAQIGPAADGVRGAIRQGMLEASNVNVVEELVTMIQTQRAYEINSKAITTSDQMLQRLSQL